MLFVNDVRPALARSAFTFLQVPYAGKSHGYQRIRSLPKFLRGQTIEILTLVLYCRILRTFVDTGNRVGYLNQGSGYKFEDFISLLHWRIPRWHERFHNQSRLKSQSSADDALYRVLGDIHWTVSASYKSFWPLCCIITTKLLSHLAKQQTNLVVPHGKLTSN